MNRETYLLLEDYMKSCMRDSAHDKEHIYRVLYTALEIAKQERDADTDVIIAACLLHDIGREEQFADPKVCHARAGAKKAYDFLIKNGFSMEFAEHVSKCILTHRYRKNNPPESLEAKILFDADKIDVAGAVGIARTLVYKGKVSEPLYSMSEDGCVLDGEEKGPSSFFQEYKYKLEGIYSVFFTKKGYEIAAGRKKAAEDFYNSMLREVREPYEKGKELLWELLEERPEKKETMRKAEREDIPRIAEILIFAKRAAYRPIFQNDAVSFNEMQVVKLADELARDGAVDHMIVYDDGIIRGMMELKRGDSPDYPGSIQLCSFYVDPFFQGLGIGRRMMEQFLKEAEMRGFCSIYLWVLEKNSRARYFYESYGFSFDGTRALQEGTAEYLLRYARDN